MRGSNEKPLGSRPVVTPSKSLWRNRLARSAVNRKVGGSSPPRDDFFFFHLPRAWKIILLEAKNTLAASAFALFSFVKKHDFLR